MTGSRSRRGEHRVHVVAASAAVVALTATWGLVHDRARLDPIWVIGLFVVGFTAAELTPIHVDHRREALSLSLSAIPLVIGLYLLAPGSLLLARVVGSGIALVSRRQPSYKLLTNLAGLWLETTVALTVFSLMVPFGDGPRSWPAAFAAALAADASQTIVIAVAITAFLGHWEHGLGMSQVYGTVAAIIDSCVAVIAVALLRHEPAAVVLFAIVVGMVIASYRVHTSLRERHRELEQLHALTGRITDALTTGEVALTVLREARELLHAEQAWLVVAEGDGECRRLSLDASAAALDVTPVEAASVAEVLHRRASGESGAFLAGRELADSGVDAAMVVALPYNARDGAAATMVVAERSGTLRGFGRKDLRLFATVANHVAVALQNSSLLDDLRAHAAAAEHRALHDALTGLPNRLLLQRRIDEAVGADAIVGVLLLDLDRFKEVNDTLGHQAGDALLVEISRRLVGVLRLGDTVARLGGDEFVVLLTGLGGPAAAVQTAQAIARALAEPVPIGETDVSTSVSIGVALAPEHGTDAGTLLQRADVAMYMAKAALSSVEVYDPERDTNTTRRLGLVAQLRHAIEHDLLAVHYQPQVAAGSGRVVSAEALVRWFHPTDGFIGPDEFVPVAEATGLIRPLTAHVIRTALTQQRRWQRAGHQLRMSVNISARNLLQPDFADDVRRALHEAGVAPCDLCLEVTETSIMADPLRAIVTLGRLRDLGVEIAVDDFGTGHSSLAYLKDLPVNEVKIDKSFVFPMLTSRRDEAIVRSIVDLARNLDLRIVAEGVEDADVLDRLRELGCHLTQGYHHARPLPPDAFEELLRTDAAAALAVW